jgi:Flp pilus assembly protein TadG
MKDRKHLKYSKHLNSRAQAIVEFAIALPVLLALIVGILEVGRLLFIYSAVTNSSRNASRYASAVGYEDSGTYRKYMYCDGIKNVAVKSAYLVPASNLTVVINYDNGVSPYTNMVTGGCNATGGEDADVFNAGVATGDRVKVTVTAQYKPMVKLIPIPARTITSSSSRTILGIIDLGN